MRLTDPARSPFLFMFFAILIAIPGGALTSALQDQIGAILAALVGLLLIASLAAALWAIGRLRARKSIGISTGPAPQRRGLVALVSQGEPEKVPAVGAIRHHESTLKYLWLIFTPPPDQEPSSPYRSSYSIAQQLRSEYQQRGVVVDMLEVRDPDNPEEVFAKAQYAYQAAARFGLSPADVLADITGGTKSMTVGLAFAGLPSSRDLQFMKPRDYLPNGQADFKAGSDAWLIDVNFVEPRHLLE